MKNNDIQKAVDENWARIAARFNTMQALEYDELQKKIDILRKEIWYRHKQLDYCIPVPSYCSPLPPSCCDIGWSLMSLNDSYVYLPGVVNALTDPPEPGTPICKEEVTTTHIIEHVDEPDMFECCACGADLKEFTKYCPHCGRLNIDFKEEN